MWDIDPKIPMGLWWALVVAAIVAIGFYGTRRDWSVTPPKRFFLTLLLGTGIVGPLLIALNPISIESIPPLPGKPQLTVLVDGTQSMRTPDAIPSTTISRWERALELAELVNAKETKLLIVKNAFDDSIVPLPSLNESSNEPRWPRGPRSDIASSIRQTARNGSPLGNAILLLSDGAHNVGSVENLMRAAHESNALATPIYTITLGTSIGMKNLSLAARSPRMIAFPDNPINILVRIGHNGLAGQTTQVTLIADDRILQSQTVRLRDDPNQEVKFLVLESNSEKMQRYRIVASEVHGEATLADNQTTVLVQRLEAPIGVLLMEGKPYWDSKFLARNLGSDPVVELTSIVKLGERRFLKKKIPRRLGDKDNETDSAREESWEVERALNSPLESLELLEPYRLIVLGRDAEVFLTNQAIENVRIWISKSGGCLLCSRGAPSNQIANKLSDMLPIRWSDTTETRFRSQVTRYGLDAAVFDPLMVNGDDPLGTMPSLAASGMPKTRTSVPQILMQSISENNGNSIPVVTYQPFGIGQTIVVEGAGMWRWAFLPPQHANKDKIYPTLWQSLIQWIVSQQDLMPGQDIAIRSDRAAFLTGDRVTASIVTRDARKYQRNDGELSAGVLLQSIESELPKRFNAIPSSVSGEIFQVDFGTLNVGFYTATIVQGEQDQVLATTSIEVRDPWFESLEVDARPDVMRRVASLSGGTVLSPEEVPGLAKRFQQRVEAENPGKVIRKTIWDRPLVLFAILCGWITTWIVRRQSGVV